MIRTFIQTYEFSRTWDELGFVDEDIRKLELCIMENPDKYPIIRGTGGLRKMRMAFSGMGKRGGVRVLFVDFPKYETTYLIALFSKKQKDNLSKAERNSIFKMICVIEQSLKEAAYE